jgi:hypothetical protein
LPNLVEIQLQLVSFDGDLTSGIDIGIIPEEQFKVVREQKT